MVDTGADTGVDVDIGAGETATACRGYRECSEQGCGVENGCGR